MRVFHQELTAVDHKLLVYGTDFLNAQIFALSPTEPSGMVKNRLHDEAPWAFRIESCP